MLNCFAGSTGDLNFFVFIPFFPVLAIPVILLCFNSQYNKTNSYWFLLLAYIVANYWDG